MFMKSTTPYSVPLKVTKKKKFYNISLCSSAFIDKRDFLVSPVGRKFKTFLICNLHFWLFRPSVEKIPFDVEYTLFQILVWWVAISDWPWLLVGISFNSPHGTSWKHLIYYELLLHNLLPPKSNICAKRLGRLVRTTQYGLDWKLQARLYLHSKFISVTKQLAAFKLSLLLKNYL